MAGLASINVRFFADLAQFSTSMQNANRQISKMGKKMTRIGKSLSVGLTAPLIGVGVAASKTFSDFEQEMAKVQAISGATGLTFSALEQSALDLGAATRYTSSQVAELQLNYSKLGFSPDEIIEVTAATLDLALATGSDLAESARVAASTLRGFGLEASEMQRVVDVMASSFSSSALDLQKFQVAMATLAPVAKNAGVSLEEATSYLAILVDRGVDATTAGTGLRNIFLDLAGSGRSLESAMTEIAQATNKNKVAFDLFGKRGATVASIMASNTLEAKNLERSFIDSGGAAGEMAKIMDNTLEGSILRMKSAIEGASISLGKELAPFIKSAAETVSELARRFNDLSPKTKKVIVVLGGVAAVLGPLLISLGFLMTTVIPGLTAAFASLTAVIAANPFGALAVAIGGAAAAFGFFRSRTNEVVESQRAFADINALAAQSIASEKAKLEELLSIAKDDKVSKEARIGAIRELNELSSQYLGDLTLEKINTDAARDAIENYNAALLKRARIRAAQQRLEEIQSKIIDAELEKEKATGLLAKQKADFAKDQAFQFGKVNRLQEKTARQQELENDFHEVKLGLTESILAASDDKLASLKDEQEALLRLIKLEKTRVTIQKSAVKKGVTKGGGVLPVLKPNIGFGEALDAELDREKLFESADIWDDFLDVDALEKEDERLEKAFDKIESQSKKFRQQMQQFSSALSGIMQDAAGSVFVGFGEMIAGLASGTIKVGSFVTGFINLIADMAIRLGKLAIQIGIGMKAIKQSFKNPFAAIAAGVALVAVGSLIKNAGGIFQDNDAGGFAGGGVVGGNSFSGDRLFARVNSGEMILNRRQQRNLTGMFQPVSSGPMDLNLVVSGELSGKAIKLAVDRYELSESRRR